MWLQITSSEELELISDVPSTSTINKNLEIILTMRS